MFNQYFIFLVALSACFCITNTTETPSTPKTNIDGANWMGDNIATLGKRTLNEICMPGSHDAGMSSYVSGTRMAHPCNVLTQSLPIKGQLENGARYFDVRPDIKGKEFQTGHYARIPGGKCVGGNGQSMLSVLDDINQFIENHNELVIVKLSHSLNLARCGVFSIIEWERIFRILEKTQNLYHDKDDKVLLGKLTLSHFTNNGTKGAVLYIVSESEVKLRHRLGQGFFYESNLKLYDEYSNTDEVDKMMTDQIKKMKKSSRDHFFTLSWTLTQRPKNALLCEMKLAKSIKELAVQAHDSLPKVISEISTNSFPNILYVDDIKDTDVLSVAMEINNKLNTF